MGNKQSKRNKRNKKASAPPKVVKNDKAVSDSVVDESNDVIITPKDTLAVIKEEITTDEQSKGLALDDISTVIEKDVEKSIAQNFDELNDTFESDEEFTITLQGKTKEIRIKKDKVNPLPEDQILAVLHTIWETNREELIKQGFSKKDASKIAGSTYEEFLPYLNVVIPTHYEPRNARAKELKAKGSDDWKLIGVNKEAINRRMKQLMAKGTLIIYRVQGKFHLVPTRSMIKNVDAYKGSIWHINQIRNILYNTKQWNQGTTPYITFFKPTNPLGLETKSFEKVLAMDRTTLQLLWTPTGFDEENLLKEIGAI